MSDYAHSGAAESGYADLHLVLQGRVNVSECIGQDNQLEDGKKMSCFSVYITVSAKMFTLHIFLYTLTYTV